MNRLELKVTVMHCMGCEQRIQAALGRMDGVVRSSADHKSGLVTVAIDPAKTTENEVRGSIRRAGFEVS